MGLCSCNNSWSHCCDSSLEVSDKRNNQPRMKIALFSDIHANLPAFEAFLLDLDYRKPAAVYCLGDLVCYNVWPNEIIEEIRRRGITTLAGNHDLKVNGLIKPSADQLQTSGKDYGYHIIEEHNRNYLLSLPSHIKLEYKLNG